MSNFMAYPFNFSLASTSEVPGGLAALLPTMPLDQEHVSFSLSDIAFPETTTTAFDPVPSSLVRLPAADSPSTVDIPINPHPGTIGISTHLNIDFSTHPTMNLPTHPATEISTHPTTDVTTHPSTDVSTYPNSNVSTPAAPPNLNRKLTRNGKPKPKEKDLNPAEDIPTTAANATVYCQWGTCTQAFRAGSWSAHFKTNNHRAEMRATRNNAGAVDCLWAGCKARMAPSGMSKHVRALHTRTYEYRCTHCGLTARGDCYVATHGLARDCRMRPGTPQLSPGTSTSASASASPATPSSSSSSSNRHSRRYSPYDRPITSLRSLDGLDDVASQVHALLAAPHGCREQPCAQEAPSTSLVQLPILSPQPIRPAGLGAFDRILSDTYTPGVAADALATAPTTPPHPEPFASGSESYAVDALGPDAEVSIYSIVANMTCFDESFVFNPDLNL